MRTLQVTLSLVCTLAVLASAAADVPRLISYQGRLTGSGDDHVNLTIRFWNDATTTDANNVLFEETHNGVTRTNGLFTLHIGSQTTGGVPDSALDATEVWLGVEVNAPPELAPRTRLAMVPFAAKSTVAEALVTPGAFDKAVHVDTDGNVGIGTSAPVHPLHVVAPPGALSGLVINCDYDAPTAVAQQIIIASREGPERLKMGFHTTYDHASIQAELYGIGYRPLILNPNGGNVGIGVTPADDAALHIGRPAVTVKLQDDQFDTVWWMRQNNSGSEFAIGTGPSTVDENIKLLIRNDGTAIVKVLQITGADVAEKFSTSEPVKAGMVLAIDPENPGQLCLARKAYDRCVAGVVSGANGLSIGAVLGNLPDHENAPPVALTGRVWCWCDASYGSLSSGDRLTTSCTPGHAMKVTDNDRAPGSVIGKAMTPLTQGRGLVLVLVQPQ